MLTTIFHRTSSFGLILAIIFSGSFVLMEETSEKNERAEGEKEAIYVQSQTTHPRNQKEKKTPENASVASLRKLAPRSPQCKVITDNFHIEFIYHSSYLDI